MFDRRFGAVVVNGRLYVNEEGFSIGSQIAAAGSSVLAGVKESVFLSTRSLLVQYELIKKCVLARWADDNLQLWEANISMGTRIALEVLADEEFYGGELEQLRGGAGEDTAFGFKIATSGGLVMARGAKNFANEQAGEARQFRWPHVHGGTQFSSERVKKATVVGRILRELDLTNCQETEAEENVRRIVLAMRIAGFEERILKSALERVAQTSWLSFQPTKAALRLTMVDCDDWCKRWDVAQKAAQVADRIRLWIEGAGGE